ncbi:ATR-interacting protein [Tupaia chinensis]|uniref:ATR-interacting protein n=1 Tax=Tupaia chinensis TaxID=246437 RepID=UPI0007041A3B|nr:ATR-interacting protein [Tupaia chinensis]
MSQCPAAARDVSSIHKVPRLDGMSKNPTGKNRESVPVKDNFELEVLQGQYRELREKLKAMEEEVLVKNGEIKILRDSLHQTESILEEQRRSHLLLEQEKAQVLSEKEKEFSKKLQSLQSELQFKDAEMNELRTKLQSSERVNKLAAPSLSRVSPRKSPSVGVKPEACSTQFGKTSFPTKESFSAHMSLSHPCQAEPGYKSLVGREDKTHSLRGDLIKQEDAPRSLINSWVQSSNTQGSILINLLLKQPLTPGSPLGLCHLLSGYPEAPTGTLLQPSGLASTLAGISGLRTTGSRDRPFSLSALREAQTLALTGLNLISRNEDSADRDPAEGGGRAFPLCRLAGAVHLLPLVQLFMGAYCQALQDLAAAKRSGAPGDSATRPSCVSSGVEASPEDSLCNLESCSVASLSVLQHLVCHSAAVVCLLLSGVEVASAVGAGCRVHRHGPREGASAPAEAAEDQGQHPLLETLLHVLALSSAAVGHSQAGVLSQCLKVLVKLAENAPSALLPRLRCVFRVLPACLGPETPLPGVLLAAELLSLLADHDQLAPQLCSRSEGCLLLLLYTYVTSRPDKAASDTQWLQLEQEAVWLLAKLGVRGPSVPLTGSDCQCSAEVVRALTVMLHRQWLAVRRAGGPPRTTQQKRTRTVRCVRDTVLLLHGLSQKDKLFSVHCVEALHQYDQVMPGVGMLIRGLPDVTDCEEAALDDLCAVEADADDPEMDCG